MLVEATRPFKLRGEVVSAGSILDVPEDALARFGDRVAPLGIAAATREFSRSLKRWEEIDEDPTATMEETRRLLARLDELYQLLHRQGHNVPTKLPIERSAA